MNKGVESGTVWGTSRTGERERREPGGGREAYRGAGRS